jgi:hypothetical protein
LLLVWTLCLSVNQQKTLYYLVERAILKDDVVSVKIYNKDSGEVIEAKITDAETNKIILYQLTK